MSRKLFQYTKDAMEDVLRAVREQNMPVAKIYKEFNVQRTSVQMPRLIGKTFDR